MSKWDRAIEKICEGVKPTMTSKSDYIKREVRTKRKWADLFIVVHIVSMI